MSRLSHITACLLEALRLWPSVPMWVVTPRSKEDKDFPVFLGEKQYQSNKGDRS